MIVYADFIAEFPEFSALPQGRVERVVEKSSRQVSADHQFAVDLVGFLTAHYLTISDPQRRGGAGGIKSIRVDGEYSIDYDVGGAASSRESLDQTSYGREYRRLLSDFSAQVV